MMRTKQISTLRFFGAFIAVWAVCVAPAFGQVNVNASGGVAFQTYSNLTTAFAAINAGTHTGTITIDLTSSPITEPTNASAVLNSSGAGPASYASILIRPTVDGASLSGNPLQGRGLIELNGADNVTIDGDNPSTIGTNRNLTITNASSATVNLSPVIRLATAATIVTSADGNTIKNCALVGNAPGRNGAGFTSTTAVENSSFGIYAGGLASTVAATTPPSPLTSVSTNTAPSGSTINNLTIDNCSLIACARAIFFNGAAATVSAGTLSITSNLVGEQTNALVGTPPYTAPATTVYTKAIFVAGTTSLTCSGNSIKNILSYVGTLMTGIELNGAIGNGTISIINNTINGLVGNAPGGSSQQAISINAATTGATLSVSGNVITNVQYGVGTSTTARPQGIALLSSSATTTTIERNNVSMIYNRSTGTAGSYGINIAATGSNNVVIRNNFVSDVNQSMTGGAAFSTTFGVFGIRIGAGTGHSVYHNSVNLFGTYFGTSNSSLLSAALGIVGTGQTGMNVRNNLLSNTLTGGTTSIASVSLFLPTNVATAMTLTNNNNAYFSGTDAARQGIAQANTTAGTGFYLASNFNAGATTPATNLRALTSILGTATNDDASLASTTAAPFTSSTDLHIPAATSSQLESGGASAGSTGVTSDIDGDTRPGPIGSVNGGMTAPDIGADEFDGTPAVNMTYVSSTTTQANTSNVPTNSANQEIIGIQIVTAGLLNPLIVTSFDLSTNGTNSASDIANAKLWYTGTSSAFATSSQYGSTVGAPSGPFTITGSQTLASGTNYFWLTYDVPCGVTVGNLIDAECNSLTVGSPQTPTVQAPPGARQIVQGPLSGTYTVGTGGNYLTLTAAVADVNSKGLGGNVLLSILNSLIEAGPITINQWTECGGSNFTLTIKPAAPNVIISASAGANQAVIVLNGADRVTIDGSVGSTPNTVCPASAASRDLAIVNTNTGTTNAVVWLQTAAGPNGATNNTVKNCILIGNSNTTTLFGVGAGGSSISTSSLGTDNDNNSIVNNSISSTQYGIYSQGQNIGNKNTGTVINQNQMTNTASPTNVAKVGIFVGFEDNITISGNRISGIVQPSSPDVFGITLGILGLSTSTLTGNEVTNATVSNNVIGSIRNTGTFSACGILVVSAATGTNQISNNMISGVSANATSPDLSVGIMICGGAGSTQVYDNSVTMVGTQTGASQPSFALAIAGTDPVVDVRNNIWVNTQNNGSGKNYAVAYGTGTFTNLTSDHNDYFVSNGATFFIGATGTSLTTLTDRLTVADLQTATGKDGDAQNVLPVFVSATDLHIDVNGANAAISGTGVSLSPTVIADIDCESRHVSAPDIGADEWNSPAGSCCHPNGTCTIQPDGAACSSAGGSNFQPGGTCGPNPCVATIPPAADCWNTTCGQSEYDFADRPIPAGFFGPGSEPFDGIIRLGGDTGPVDTVVQRMQPMTFDNNFPSPPQNVPIELVSLSLVSCEPIKVRYCPGAPATEWTVAVDLSAAPLPGPGTMTVTKTHQNGGTFESTFQVKPRFTFTRVVPPSGPTLVLDTGIVGPGNPVVLPPISLTSIDPIPWVHSTPLPLSPPACGTNFVPGVHDPAGPPATPGCTPSGSCSTLACHAGPGHKHCTGPVATPCPCGACVDLTNTCTEVSGMDPELTCESVAGRTFLGVGTTCHDSDGDGLADAQETNNACTGSACTGVVHPYYPTNPFEADTDGDALPDAADPAPTNSCIPITSPECDEYDLTPSPAVGGGDGDTDDDGNCDFCEIASGASYDCNHNGVPDENESGGCCTGASCSMISAGACRTAGGHYYGHSVPCPVITDDGDPCTTEGCTLTGPPGVTHTPISCPSGQHCEGGVCVPDVVTGACCDVDGGCSQTTSAATCPYGIFRGVGTSCPDTCPPTATTPDEFCSSATVVLQTTNFGLLTATFPVPPTALPNTMVRRTSPPYLTGEPIPTEIIQMSLQGTINLPLPLGPQPIVITERLDKSSLGRMDNVIAGPLPAGAFQQADSFFDVFVTIDLPTLPYSGNTDEIPVRVSAPGITNLPPYGASFTSPPTLNVPVFPEPPGAGPTSIVSVTHNICPPPESKCIYTVTCVSGPLAGCPGMPMCGDKIATSLCPNGTCPAGVDYREWAPGCCVEITYFSCEPTSLPLTPLPNPCPMPGPCVKKGACRNLCTNECTLETAAACAGMANRVYGGDCTFCPAGPPVPVDCDDNNPCTDDLCDPLTGQCSHPFKPAGTSCGVDPTPCTRLVCDGAGGCITENKPYGTPCGPDPSPCERQVCDGLGGCIIEDKPDGTPCDDGDPCTGPDTCVGGVCSGPLNYNPATHCCNPTTGALTAISDGNACTTDTCNPDGSVTHTPTYNTATHCCNPANGALTAIDDGDACTEDVCNANGSVTHTITTPAGMCCDPTNGNLTQITDNNACTTDTCNADGSVTHTVTTPAGQCCNPANGALTLIDDSDPCTTDTCNADGSVTHTQICGACCTSGVCALTTAAACIAPSTFQGVGSVCTPNPCAVPPTVSITVELGPGVDPTNGCGPYPATITRCIDFVFYKCSPPTATYSTSMEMTFTVNRASPTGPPGCTGGAYDPITATTAMPLSLPAGAWDCAIARDRLHTLASKAELSGGPAYTVSFTGKRSDEPGGGGGGHRLPGGNLNDDPYIDILDFGAWAGQYLVSYANGDTSCMTTPVHADVSGDGEVDSGDFTFIAINYLMVSDESCCPTFLLPSPYGERRSRGPVTSISVDQLRQRGMGDMAAGDVNNDGMLNAADVADVMMGHMPRTISPVPEVPTQPPITPSNSGKVGTSSTVP